MDADRRLTASKLVSVTASDRQPLDRADVFTFSIELFVLTFGVSRGNLEGWSSSVITGALVVAAVG